MLSFALDTIAERCKYCYTMAMFRSIHIQQSRLSVVFLSVTLVLLTLLLIAPLLHQGVPSTHDGEGHVARAANYYLAIKQGQFPPRWAPNFWNGFGYPVFNFHYPLLSIAATPLIILDAHPEWAVKLVLAAALIVLVLSVVRLGQHWFSFSAGLWMGLLVVLSPYLFNLLYVRGTYGEVLSYTCLAVLLVSRQEVLRRQHWLRRGLWLSSMLVASVGIALAHNILAMILLPCLVVGLLIDWWRHRHTWPTVITMLGGFGISSFFWIPAILEKNMTLLDEIKVGYTDHFATISQLLFAPVKQGVSVAGAGDLMSFSFGLLTVITVLSSIALILHRKLRGERTSYTSSIVALCLTALALWLSTGYSAVIWQHIPVLQYVQFPWRFVGIALVPVIYLAGFVWHHAPRVLIGIFIISLVLISRDRISWPIREYFHFSAEYYLQYTQTTTVWDEMRAKTWQIPVYVMSQNHPTISPPSDVRVLEWTGTYHHYTINLDQPARITEPTMFFPGWKTSIGGRIIAYNISDHEGQISFMLPAGSYEVRTQFTQDTPARLIGNMLSIICLAGTFGWLGIYTGWSYRASLVQR